MSNLNIGLLGHVDSGKTSIAKALSQTQSTASFDKSSQSRDRGITLDLGFSSFRIALSELQAGRLHMRAGHATLASPEALQVTLVDCPGHASLLRTVLAGTQIMDAAILVIDATKGIQVQTAECVALCEIYARHRASFPVFVVLNKTDLLPAATRAEKLERQRLLLSEKVFGKQLFPRVHFSCVSAVAGKAGVASLYASLAENLPLPARETSGELLVPFEHCFSVKGKGTVLTGTVVSGTISRGETVYVSSAMEEKIVKGLQIFRTEATSASTGDRVAVLVSCLSKKLERGYLCKDKRQCLEISKALVEIRKIRHFKGECYSGKSIHVTIGFSTAMATPTFCCPESPGEFNCNSRLRYLKSLSEGKRGSAYALLSFEKDVLVTKDALVFAARLDCDQSKSPFRCRFVAIKAIPNSLFCGHLCSETFGTHPNAPKTLVRHAAANKATRQRLVFSGKVVFAFPRETAGALKAISVYKEKSREGVIVRMHNGNSAIARHMFGVNSDLSLFKGMRVVVNGNSELCGVIEGPFGNFRKTGKFRIGFDDRVATLLKDALSLSGEQKVRLDFKKPFLGASRRIFQ